MGSTTSENHGTSGVGRRDLIKRSAALGLISVPTMGFLSACASGGGGDNSAEGNEGKTSDSNPFGVKKGTKLDVVIFKGGYGDDYAIKNNERFNSIYPNVKITYAGTQRLQEQYQARFVDGNPPDVMDNSGAGNFNNTTL